VSASSTSESDAPPLVRLRVKSKTGDVYCRAARFFRHDAWVSIEVPLDVAVRLHDDPWLDVRDLPPDAPVDAAPPAAGAGPRAAPEEQLEAAKETIRALEERLRAAEEAHVRELATLREAHARELATLARRAADKSDKSPPK
jgi:hypothetical protein